MDPQHPQLCMWMEPQGSTAEEKTRGKRGNRFVGIFVSDWEQWHAVLLPAMSPGLWTQSSYKFFVYRAIPLNTCDTVTRRPYPPCGQSRWPQTCQLDGALPAPAVAVGPHDHPRCPMYWHRPRQLNLNCTAPMQFRSFKLSATEICSDFICAGVIPCQVNEWKNPTIYDFIHTW
jgi:hypothetical protein